MKLDAARGLASAHTVCAAGAGSPSQRVTRPRYKQAPQKPQEPREGCMETGHQGAIAHSGPAALRERLAKWKALSSGASFFRSGRE